MPTSMALAFWLSGPLSVPVCISESLGSWCESLAPGPWPSNVQTLPQVLSELAGHCTWGPTISHIPLN